MLTNLSKNKIGAFPAQFIRKMIKEGEIINADENNIQPASIDLSISDEGYRMRGAFLPRKNESVREIIKEESLYKIDLNNPLEKNGIYLIRINEKLNLPKNIFAFSSSKSSVGRVDLQTRLIVNGYSRFDSVLAGYQGELWLQVIPKSFLIKLNFEDKLNQVRFFNGEAKIGGKEIEKIYAEQKLLFNENSEPASPGEKIAKDSNGGIVMNINLNGEKSDGIVGYKNLLVDCVLDFSKMNYYNPDDFFEPVYAPQNGKLILEKESFYIFSTKELIRVPGSLASEMIAYDIYNGEFRSHYAGFFDPGFGYGEDGEIKGRQAVLEIRSYENNFIFRDDQPICRMNFERLIEPADFIYGEEIGSHYANQSGPKLSKHFK
ncbi:MAG: 2'-deoxycytidine 5'-triphosphate deaminase [Patescibacteria group bacterium]|nr:2'-deoxycytidine 5'-triphosphate deaminase [Patescibacteria group bacterium]